MELSVFLQFIKEHPSHAMPILIVGGISVAIVIERFFTLYVRYSMGNTDGFFEKISQLVLNAQINKASELCDRYGSKPIASVVKSALTRSHLPEGLIRDGIQLTVQNCSKSILKRTAYLATSANVATL